MLKRTVIGVVASFMVVATAFAAGGPSNGSGSGMESNMGSGMGPGMMAPNMGPGMMQRNMGPGMMGQHRGPGMTGPRGPQGAGPFAGVQFNEKQREMIREMMQKERKSNEARVESMQAAQQKLQKL
ncbi:MAG TPA: hypothetical protein ENH92_04270 [Ectothiorhodospiraceae bacterium]|nr:hypothetical protein [Ectothiorhodospiraceae bacterium]